MKKTNFDLFLEEQLRVPDFAARFKQAGETWALQFAALREAGWTLASRTRPQTQNHSATNQPVESPDYEGHSLSMLRSVASALHARVRVVLEPDPASKAEALAEEPVPYRVKRTAGKHA